MQGKRARELCMTSCDEVKGGREIVKSAIATELKLLAMTI